MSVLEYLFSLNLMQKQCNLSKAEFMQMMLASTTGKPHIYLMRRIQEKDDLSNIYHNLLLHYDKRMEPEEARIKLYALRHPNLPPWQRLRFALRNSQVWLPAPFLLEPHVMWLMIMNKCKHLLGACHHRALCW